jgi:hypothetical protein
MDLATLDFSEHLRPGVIQEDIAGLAPLVGAQQTLSAFVALFRGGDEEVMIRLLVLREISSRGDDPTWSPQQLQSHFAYLEPTKFATVIQRLREHALLVWDAEQSVYRVSEIGRMALAAVSSMLKFSPDEGGDLGYIISQVAASHSVAMVGADNLQHLLSRLTELQQEFDRAVLSGSEFRIRHAEHKLNSVWQWVEKGTEVIRAIASTPDVEPEAHAIAQRIGRAQSRMLRMTSVFQRTLNQLESQKIHLGQSGLSSSDITAWLRTLSPARLAKFANEAIGLAPQLAFVLGDIALDVGEFELLERIHESHGEGVLPPAREAPSAELVASTDDLNAMRQWIGALLAIEQTTELADCLPMDDFETASYRLSLLSLMSDPESAALQGPMAALARVPVSLRLTGKETPVGRHGIHSVSEGYVIPKRHSLNSAQTHTEDASC